MLVIPRVCINGYMHYNSAQEDDAYGEGGGAGRNSGSVSRAFALSLSSIRVTRRALRGKRLTSLASFSFLLPTFTSQQIETSSRDNEQRFFLVCCGL
jgi:hypothetical protein